MISSYFQEYVRVIEFINAYRCVIVDFLPSYTTNRRRTTDSFTSALTMGSNEQRPNE